MLPTPPPPPSPPSPPLRPRRLGPGSRVALVAPAGPLDTPRIDAAVARCRSLGFEPVVGARALHRSGFLAGTDADRLDDAQAAFDDPATDAVWALRGGYGTGRIVDDLALARMRTDPIPFLGFSDNTVLHARLTALGVVSFHAPHPTAEGPTADDEWFARVLTRPEAAGRLPGDPGETLVSGRAEGRLVGGNLALLASLSGTCDAVSARDRILVIEDVGEPAYRIDRMLVQLRRAGTTAGVAGLAFGRFTDVPGADDEGVRRVLREFAETLGVPSAMGLPVGHAPDNSVLPLGTRARLDADAGTLDVIEPAVV